MIQGYGYTPHQHVFGRNPELPGDLLNEPLHVVPGTAGLSDDAVARAQAIRTSARHAVIALQDDKALRHALAARPRATIHFCPGDLVCYWRNQKLVGKGVVQQGGRWYGTAVIIGQIGKNWIVAHRRQIIRCAPEQLRPATTEERTLISSPQAELLGVKDLIEGGTFKSHQLIDLVPGHYPTSESSQQSPDTGTQENPDVQKPAVDEKAVTPPSVQPMTRDDEPKPTIQPPDWNAEQSNVPSNTSSASTDRPRDTPQAESSSYGPIRRRVDQKSGATALYRPAAMRQEDFLEVIKEVVPRLIDEAMQPTDESMDAGLKRPLTPSHADEVQEPPTSKHRGSEDDEVLSVEEINQHLSQGSIESLIAAYMEKKLSKEIPPSNNPPELQKLVDESKGVEWNTIADKQAIRLHFGKKALKIKEQFADRFIGSRFVIIRKAIQDGIAVDIHDPTTFKIKSRWVVQGHLDPDLALKAEEGMLQSPTLSQLGRMTLMQVIASFRWKLQLGDIKGAFLEAGSLPEKYRPLYAKMPPGGIPGVPNREDVVIEIVGNIYGQNDAPRAWHRTFDTEALKLGWTRSILDPCLYTLRCPKAQKLVGIMGIILQ